MITSMTGFGRGATEKEGVQVRVELRSVNSRFCDIQMRCAGSVKEFEPEIRERLQERLTRGKITAQIEWEEESGSGELPVLNEGMAKRYLQELERLRDLDGLSGEVELADLARLPGLFRMEATMLEPEVAKRLVLQAVDLALEDFLQMRATEGETLSRDLRQRVERLETNLQRIETLTAGAQEQIRGKLREKVEALLKPGEVNEERLTMEVVLIAERSDVTEEMVRLHSHNAQFLESMEKGGEAGRRLNFLLQEMNREANTINSKSNDPEVIHLVVEMKEEIERLREQVQNLA